jgi:hypothetical protein
MILAAAVALGLAVSLARHGSRAFGQIAAIRLRSAWLAILALALQLPLLRASAGAIEDLRPHRVLLLLSYLLLLLFVWRNRRRGAILIVGVGLVCNLLVILTNRGFMPITPQILVRINPTDSAQQWLEGTHYGYSKDIILAQEDTRLWLLSDVLAVPPPFPWPTAFSVGDLILAAGIVVLLAAPEWDWERRTRDEA